MCVCVRVHKTLPLSGTAMGEVWLEKGQVVKGLERQAKESGLCSEGTGEPQKGFEQGRAGSGLSRRKLLCEAEWVGGGKSGGPEPGAGPSGERLGRTERRLVDETLRRPGGQAVGGKKGAVQDKAQGSGLGNDGWSLGWGQGQGAH